LLDDRYGLWSFNLHVAHGNSSHFFLLYLFSQGTPHGHLWHSHPFALNLRLTGSTLSIGLLILFYPHIKNTHHCFLIQWWVRVIYVM
jgi:hypothetical protein